MRLNRVLLGCAAVLVSAASLAAAGSSDLPDAVMNGNKAAVRSLLLKKADVNGTQVDGTTALHWAVRGDDLETADLLIKAGANVTAANREGVTPMELAALNGSTPMIESGRRQIIFKGPSPTSARGLSFILRASGRS